MPEDLKDKIYDFELMLLGFVVSTRDLAPTEQERNRIMSYWYSMSGDVLEVLNKAEKTKTD